MGKACAVCKTEFEPYRPWSLYCGRPCSSKAYYLSHRDAQLAAGVVRYAAWRNKNPTKRLVQISRARAKKLGLKHDLTAAWADEKWTGHCAVTGIKFTDDRKLGPFSPSVDRIDPKLGYVAGNCLFVLRGVNMLKGTGSYADAALIARAMVAALAGERHEDG